MTTKDLGFSPETQALINASLAFLNDDGPGFIEAWKAHDWGTVALKVIKAELVVAAAIPGPQQFAAGVAIRLIPLFVFAANHPHNSGENGIGADPEGNGNVAL